MIEGENAPEVIRVNASEKIKNLKMGLAQNLNRPIDSLTLSHKNKDL